MKPHGCAIFQAKNNKNDWSVMINLSDDGTITLNHRRHQDDKIIARRAALVHIPGLSAPKRKARTQAPDAVLVNCGCIRRLTASLSSSGRMPSALIVPP